MSVRIDRCLCENKTFELLLRLAKEKGYTEVEQLAQTEKCGTHCGLCVAYLRRALKDGTTVFTALLPPEKLRIP